MIPLEHEEQAALFEWSALMQERHPELRMLYAIPNGHAVGYKRGRRANREGRKPGVPDVCLPVARGAYHALYIELKRRKGGRVAPEQKGFLGMLAESGNCACVARGWEHARDVILQYLALTQ